MIHTASPPPWPFLYEKKKIFFLLHWQQKDVLHEPGPAATLELHCKNYWFYNQTWLILPRR